MIRALGNKFIVGFLLVYAVVGQADTELNQRMTVLKAGLVNGISSYTTWPHVDVSMPLNICLLAKDDAFSEALNRFYEKKPPSGGRKMAIDVVSIDNLDHCQIVVILGRQNRQSNQLLDSVKGFPILTISDDPNFAANGGHVSFFNENNRLRFEVNYQATVDSNLKISSRLLTLARVINK